MNTKNSKAFSSHGSENSQPTEENPQDEYEDVLERLSKLEEETQEHRDKNEELADRVEMLEAETDRLHEENHALAQENQELREQQDNNRADIEAVEKQTQINRSRLDQNTEWKEELLTFLDLDPDEPIPNEPRDPQRDLEEAETKVNSIAKTFVEKLTTLPEGVTTSANVKRARFLAMDIKQYATRGKDGWILDPERMKNALYARENDPAAAHDQTVERVRGILAENGGEDIEIGQQSFGRKKKIVQFSDNIVSRLTNLAKIREEAPSLVCEDRIPSEG